MARKSSKLLRKALKIFSLWTITIVLVIGLGFSAFPILAAIPSAQPSTSILAQTPSSNTQQLVQQGRDLYRSGQWQQALEKWEQANTAFANTGDNLNQAMVLGNIALAHRQLEQLPEAQKAMTDGQTLLDSLPSTAARARHLSSTS